MGCHLFPALVMSDAHCLKELLFLTNSLKMTHWFEQNWEHFLPSIQRTPSAHLCLLNKISRALVLCLLTGLRPYIFQRHRQAVSLLILSHKILSQTQMDFVNMMFQGYFRTHSHSTGKGNLALIDKQIRYLQHCRQYKTKQNLAFSFRN